MDDAEDVCEYGLIKERGGGLVERDEKMIRTELSGGDGYGRMVMRIVFGTQSTGGTEYSSPTMPAVSSEHGMAETELIGGRRNSPVVCIFTPS